ncbi:hypothetical protein FQR65_LT15089 [Abscondita terminalis]|nr:hypothetical protein FQR65_LT15089 [Abscondita terminalis]
MLIHWNYPPEKAHFLNNDEIDLLLDNYENTDLWKSKFPPESWILKGFFIISLTDVTPDFSLSELKSNLLSIDPETGALDNSFEPILRSYFEIPDLRTGFMFFNHEQNRLEKLQNNRALFSSSILEFLYDKLGSLQFIRNKAQQEDLLEQLNRLISIYENLKDEKAVNEKILFGLKILAEEVETGLKTDTEQRVIRFLANKVHLELEENNTPEIINYFSLLDSNGQLLYKRRKAFDDTVSTINKNFASLLEKREQEAQLIFPHYFELFKTDGVEHNIYVGQSINPTQHYSKEVLYQLRYWQLETLCEMELSHESIKSCLPYNLDVHTLILVFNVSLSIRFRMDEKRFDVDGAYNSRYEVIKKRIDKAYIKNTTERITQPGKICIVYSSNEDEKEYYSYIQQLQEKGYLTSQVEKLEVEELPEQVD